MARFFYSGFSNKGEERSGEIDASNSATASLALARRGITVVQIHPRHRAGTDLPNLRLPALAALIKDLALMAEGAVPIDTALNLIAAETHRGPVRRLAEHLRDSVNAGSSLSEAFASAGSANYPEIVGAIRAGEVAGRLSQALMSLAKLLEGRVVIRAKLISALAYPTFVLALACASIAVISLFLVPAVVPILTESGKDLPASLRFLVTINDQASFILALGGALTTLVCVAAWRWRHLTRIRYFVEKAILSLPVVGQLARKIYLIAFAQTVGALLQAGVPLLGALEAGRDQVSNRIVASRIQLAIRAVEGGAPLDQALIQFGAIDSMAGRLIAIGSRTGELGASLTRVSTILQSQLAQRSERALALLGPLLTVAVALLIGLLMTSVMTALLSLNDLTTQ